jgi:diaminobutyrate-2-oxoglutarate transaminase
MLDLIDRLESGVRSYVRSFPAVFRTASGSWLTDVDGRRYLDFFCGAGSLNYGHNNPLVKQSLLDYIASDGIQHSLDMATHAKIRFLKEFQEVILEPRGLNYRVQFTGPTGANAVEAAIKLAKKVTRRSHVVAFTNAYHGHSLGALSLTGNQYYHDEHYGSHNNVSHLPYHGYLGDFDTAEYLARLLKDRSSGLPLPAAVILETVQGEGGVNVASVAWLRKIAEICRNYGIMLIVDDIQVGNGRTGEFFSFETAEITPDLICVSKSLGGGLPIALVLLRPDLDQWLPGEHTGTFRGNNLAFVAARSLLKYWRDDALVKQIQEHEQQVRTTLQRVVSKHVGQSLCYRGRGLIWGLELAGEGLARRISALAFERGLIVETAGAQDQVLKLLPPLTISSEDLQLGLGILEQAVADVITQSAGAVMVGPLNSAGVVHSPKHFT